MTNTKTNTFRKHLQRATLETCELWDIWPEWWGDMTWPTKRQWRRQWLRKTKWLMTFETLITILKIENLNSWKSLLPDKSNTGQHSQFLPCFCTTLATNGTHCYPVCNHFYLLLLSSVQSLPPFTQLSGATKWVSLITSKGQLMLRPPIKYHLNLYLFFVFSIQFIQCQSKQVRLKGFYFW